MAARRKTEVTVPQSEEESGPPGLLRRQVGIRLGLGKGRVQRLVDEGYLHPFFENGHEYFDEAEVDEFQESGLGTTKKDAVLDQSLKALKDAHDQVNRIVNAVINPLMTINNLLVEENKSLREKQDKLFEEVFATNQLYNELQKSIAEEQTRAAREELNVEQRKEAFMLLKEQLMPAIIENLGARKVLENIGDDEFDVLLEAGVLSESQTKAVKAYREKRRAKAQKMTVPQSEEKETKNGSSKTTPKP